MMDLLLGWNYLLYVHKEIRKDISTKYFHSGRWCLNPS